MKIKLSILLLLSLSFAQGQKVIPLYSGKVPGSEDWNWQEKEMFSEEFQVQFVYNVSVPTLTAYLPPAATANGTSVIICPGGALHVLNINSEGIDVAKWLNTKGVAAFVLKYRLVKSETNDPIKELRAKTDDTKKFDWDRIRPLAIADGLEAIKYLRMYASGLNINPERIGIMGFSSGGTLTAGVAFNGSGESRPDFMAFLYANMPRLKDKIVPEDAPPIFIAAATDDHELAPQCVTLYNKWIEAGKSAELHMYAKGGHGFGMRKQNLPSDSWIDCFGEWLEAQGLLKKR